MSGTVLIGALSAIAAILLVLFFRLGDNDEGKHYILQVLFLGFIIGVIVLIGKTAIDYKDNCAWLVSNSSLSGATTLYEYTYECSENTNNTASILYQVCLWIFSITVIYIFLYYFYEVFNYFKIKRRGGE